MRLKFPGYLLTGRRIMGDPDVVTLWRQQIIQGLGKIPVVIDQQNPLLRYRNLMYETYIHIACHLLRDKLNNPT